MNKTHFGTGPNTVCGRGHRGTENVFAVTCLVCQQSPLFERALFTAKQEKEAKFLAQEPLQFAEPWKGGIITCNCGNTTFRQAGRSCHGHYEDFVCAACGETTSRLTETGMSY